MFYTAQSGIWQTVWMEIVPEDYIRDLRITPDFDNGHVKIRMRTECRTIVTAQAMPLMMYSQIVNKTSSDSCEDAKGSVHASALCRIYPPVYLDADRRDGELCQQPITEAFLKPGKEISIPVPAKYQKHWSPEKPWLYPVSIEYGEDRVLTYFALRKCDVQMAEDRYPRFFLNHEPYFQSGVLDQGYWPDGLYTAPSDEALIYDIRAMKDLGFNMLRKHGKIEAEPLVFPLRPHGHAGLAGHAKRRFLLPSLVCHLPATLLNWMRIPVKDIHAKLLSRTDEDGRQEYVDDSRGMIRALYNHPSIVTWIPFNEGWGQFSTKQVTDMIHKLDSSRPGGFRQRLVLTRAAGDINSLHYYFLGLPIPRSKRVLALSEFGGYSLRIPETQRLQKYLLAIRNSPPPTGLPADSPA